MAPKKRGYPVLIMSTVTLEAQVVQGIVPTAGSRILTVMGPAWSLAQDIQFFGIKGDVMTISDATGYYPGSIRHAVTRHNREITPPLLGLRSSRRRESPLYVHALRGDVGLSVTTIWHLLPHPDDSGLMGALLGVAMGYEDVRLLGLPLAPGGHFYDFMGKGAKNSDYPKQFRKAWEKANPVLQGVVRSAGGWTRELLGEIQS